MNKKVTISLIIILFIFSGLVLVYFYNKNYVDEPGVIEDNQDDDGNNDDTINPDKINYKMLIIDNISTWGYYDDKWYNLSPENIEEEKYNVYINQDYYGDFYLKFGTVWNLFDNNKNFINYSGNLLAFSDNFNINVQKFDLLEVSITEINEISTILNYDIDFESLTTNEVVNIDLDKNGINDKIVNVSNLDANSIQKKYFNLCYVVLNNEIQILINENVDEKMLLLYPKYNIEYILSFSNNEYYSFIMQEGYFSEVDSTKNNLYAFSNNKYTKLFGD